MELNGALRPGLPLVVAALVDEIRPLIGRYPVLLTGVGKVNAAVAVSRALAGPVTPSMVVNLGTAGALVDGLHGTHEVSAVLQHDFASASVSALVGSRQGGPLRLADGGPVLATGDAFIADARVRQRLAADAQLCDMEGYAVVAAARAAGVAVRVIKHVSDPADESSARTWLESLDAGAQALTAWVDENLG